MVNEVELGLEYVNERCGTNFTNPEEVLVAYEDYATRLVANQPVDFEYDTFRMSISLFASSHQVMRPLESAIARKASEIWLKRHCRR